MKLLLCQNVLNFHLLIYACNTLLFYYFKLTFGQLKFPTIEIKLLEFVQQKCKMKHLLCQHVLNFHLLIYVCGVLLFYYFKLTFGQLKFPTIKIKLLEVI